MIGVINVMCIVLFFLPYDIHANAPRLIVDDTLYNQIIHNNMQNIYTVEELLLNAKYEVRISYSAVIPTDFILRVEPISSTHLNRKTFNVEQLQWKATDQGYQITVTARRTGLPFNMERLQDWVPFNIVVNRLYFGCSFGTWKIIVACLLTNIIILKLALPPLLKTIDGMLNEQKLK